MQVSVELGNQAMALEVKSLGCPAPEFTKTLGKMFNKKRGVLHLCGSRPCATANHYELHATRIRIYKLEDFNADYVTRSMKTQIRKWMGGGDEEDVDKSDVKPPAKRIKGKGGMGVAGIRPGAIRFRPKAMAGRKEKKEAAQKDKGGITPPPSAAVSKLKEKLASLKVSGSEKSAPWDTVEDAEAGLCEVVSSEEEEYQPSPERLDTGTEIIPFHSAVKDKKRKRKEFWKNVVAARRLKLR